jgi:hypothetical protein
MRRYSSYFLLGFQIVLFWIGESVVVILDGRGKQQSTVLFRAVSTF